MTEEIIIALAIAGGIYLLAKANDASAVAAAVPPPASSGALTNPAANNVATSAQAALDQAAGNALQGWL